MAKGIGFVKRQNIKSNILAYLGTFIALLSTIWVYPRALEAYGTSQALFSLALLLTPFMSLGTINLSTRFFPFFKDDLQGRQLFLCFLIYVCAIGSLLFPLALWMLFQALLPFFSLAFDFSWIIDYKWYLLILAVALTFSQLLTQYIANFKRIVVPVALNNLLPKLSIPILVWLFAEQQISLSQFLSYTVLLYVGVAFGLLLYLRRLRELPRIRHFLQPSSVQQRAIYKQMPHFAIYSILAALGYILAIKFDVVMVASLLGKREAGIYQIAIFAAMVIDIPLRATINIVGPMIASCWAIEDRATMADLYARSSLVLTAVGASVAVLMLVSIQDIFALTVDAEALELGYWALAFVCVGKIGESIVSVSDPIIDLSPTYIFRMLAILVLGCINLLLNYFFIASLGWGLAGAGLATMLALLIYSFVKWLFIYRQFNMNPLSWRHLKLLLMGAILLLLLPLIGGSGFSLLDIVLRSTVGLGGLVLVFYFTNWVPDLRAFLRESLQAIRNRLG